MNKKNKRMNKKNKKKINKSKKKMNNIKRMNRKKIMKMKICKNDF